MSEDGENTTEGGYGSHRGSDEDELEMVRSSTKMSSVSFPREREEGQREERQLSYASYEKEESSSESGEWSYSEDQQGGVV